MNHVCNRHGIVTALARMDMIGSSATGKQKMINTTIQELRLTSFAYRTQNRILKRILQEDSDQETSVFGGGEAVDK